MNINDVHMDICCNYSFFHKHVMNEVLMTYFCVITVFACIDYNMGKLVWSSQVACKFSLSYLELD